MFGRRAVAVDRLHRRSQDVLVVVEPAPAQLRDRNRLETEGGGCAGFELAVDLGRHPLGGFAFGAVPVRSTSSRSDRLKVAKSIWNRAGAVDEVRIRIEFSRIAKAIGLVGQTAPKVLRHQFATALQEGRVDLSGMRIVGLNKSGSASASRSPNDTQNNGAPRSIVRMERRTFWRASVCHVPSLIPTIRPASPQNTANKAPKTSIGAMITS